MINVITYPYKIPTLKYFMNKVIRKRDDDMIALWPKELTSPFLCFLSNYFSLLQRLDEAAELPWTVQESEVKAGIGSLELIEKWVALAVRQPPTLLRNAWYVFHNIRSFECMNGYYACSRMKFYAHLSVQLQEW